MIRIAHIVNPVTPRPESDLNVAQPVTFETMRAARRFSMKTVEVELLSAQYPEDRPVVPAGFKRTPDLEGSALDLGRFGVPRKLPFIKDILDRLYEHSEAEILIYTNVDIALQPYFYSTVACLAAGGHEAFAINRRTIPSDYEKLYDIPLMYAEIGERHKGWDCFVYQRRLYPGFDLGHGLVGSGWIGRILLTNLACLGRKFRIFTDEHATFHIGNRRSWKSDRLNDYLDHNREECRRILHDFERTRGPLDREAIPGRFLNLLEKQTGRP